jgi:hypothetical protein
MEQFVKGISFSKTVKVKLNVIIPNSYHPHSEDWRLHFHRRSKSVSVYDRVEATAIQCSKQLTIPYVLNKTL